MPLTRTRLVAGSVTLLAVSFAVVLKGANDEPYFVFKSSDVLVQVGVAAALVVLWVLLGARTVAGVMDRALSKPWLGVLPVFAFSIYCLIDGALGYTGDIERFALPSQQRAISQASAWSLSGKAR